MVRFTHRIGEHELVYEADTPEELARLLSLSGSEETPKMEFKGPWYSVNEHGEHKLCAIDYQHEIPTSELANLLICRQGVHEYCVHPYQGYSIVVGGKCGDFRTGPARILVITD